MADVSMPGAVPLLPFANDSAAPAPPGMFRTLAISASGLTAQRVRMELAANNIANAETTHGPNGQPYQREVVTIQPNVPQAPGGHIPALLPLGNNAPDFADAARQAISAPVTEQPDTPPGVQVAAVTNDQTPGPLVYDPGHPDADAHGYVRYPNVQITQEMVEIMDSRRVYEANATAFEVGKAMLRRAIDI
jgi:flagellar basal-body rod protein FlgC